MQIWQTIADRIREQRRCSDTVAADEHHRQLARAPQLFPLDGSSKIERQITDLIL